MKKHHYIKKKWIPAFAGMTIDKKYTLASAFVEGALAGMIGDQIIYC